jgi:hypothetical protein
MHVNQYTGSGTDAGRKRSGGEPNPSIEATERDPGSCCLTPNSHCKQAAQRTMTIIPSPVMISFCLERGGFPKGLAPADTNRGRRFYWPNGPHIEPAGPPANDPGL